MGSKIFLGELAEGLAKRKGVAKKEAESFVRSVFDIVEEYLTKEKIVKIKGLGTFKLVDVESRESVKVNTGERFVIDGHSRVTFTPDAVLRDQVNKPFADFETVVLCDGVDLAEMERTDYPLEPLVSTPLPPLEGEDEENTVFDSEPASEEPVLEETVLGVPETEEPIPAEETPVVEEEPIEEEPQAEETPVAEEGPIEEEPVAEELAKEEPEKESRVEVAPMHIEHQTVEEMTVTTQHVEHQTIQHITPALPSNSGGHHHRRRHHLSWRTLLMQLMLVLLLMLGTFCLGLNWKHITSSFMSEGKSHFYCYVDDEYDSVEFEEEDTLVAEPTDETPVQEEVAKQPEKTQSEAVSQPVATPKPATPKPVVPQPKPAQQPAAKKPAERPDIYLEMRGEEAYPQLANGAYRIVGIKAVHTLAPGDYLYKISRQYYGDNSAAAYIVLLNGITDRENIPIGTRINLPVLEKK